MALQGGHARSGLRRTLLTLDFSGGVCAKERRLCVTIYQERTGCCMGSRGGDDRDPI